MIPPLERRLQLVTGKGGTGKTTLVAALALAHAARGRKPLVVELGHRASLVRVLDVEAIGHVPTEVLPRVFATNIELGPATEGLVRRVIPSRTITARALRAGPVRVFLDAAPGVVEVATLDRLRTFVDESDFDPILVDGDATGHTRMLFALHGVLGSLGVSGPIADLLDRVAGVFASPAHAAVHVATLPTTLATDETLELWAELRDGGVVALGHALLNRVPERHEGIAAQDVARVEAVLAEREPALASAVALLRVHEERRTRAEALRERLAARGTNPRTIPEHAGAALDRNALAVLGHALLGGGS